jgi:hypothetical protein
MKKTSTQEKEQHYFEMFRKYYSLPFGAITYGDKPDVILEGERKIGIEITSFYLEQGELLESEQRQRGLRDTIISDAQRVYEAKNKKKIELTIEFDKANPIRGTKEVVAKLVALAEQVKEYKTGQIDNYIFQNIPEVSSIYLYADDCAAPNWRGVQSYCGSIISRDNLIRIVRDKEDSSRQYKKCDTLWLLIIVEFLDRAQDQEIQIANFEKVESKVFEKIIIYKTTFHHLREAK